jgi:sn-glycerol 3-phosphate transport system substrate-binding protein
MRGMNARLSFNSPLHVRHIENLANMAKTGPVRLQGPGQRGRRNLRLGRVRHDHRLVRALRQHQAQRQVRERHCTLPYYPDVPARRRTP